MARVCVKLSCLGDARAQNTRPKDLDFILVCVNLLRGDGAGNFRDFVSNCHQFMAQYGIPTGFVQEGPFEASYKYVKLLRENVRNRTPWPQMMNFQNWQQDITAEFSKNSKRGNWRDKKQLEILPTVFHRCLLLPRPADEKCQEVHASLLIQIAGFSTAVAKKYDLRKAVMLTRSGDIVIGRRAES